MSDTESPLRPVVIVRGELVRLMRGLAEERIGHGYAVDTSLALARIAIEREFGVRFEFAEKDTDVDIRWK